VGNLATYADPTHLKCMPATRLMSSAELAKVPGLGAAKRGNATLTTDALSVRELIGDKGKLAVGEISEPYTGLDGEPYIYRVTAVKANHEPASLDEVRAEVLADVKKIKAFEIARDKAKKIVAEAATKGLEQAAKDQGVKIEVTDYFPQIKEFVPFQGQLFELPPRLPGVEGDRAVLAECFRMASEGKKLSDVVLAGRDMAVVIEKMDQKAPRSAVYEKTMSDQEKLNLLKIVNFKIGSAGMHALQLDAVVARNNVKVTDEKGNAEFSLPRSARMGSQQGGGDDGGDF
jgi:hypothetical protein